MSLTHLVSQAFKKDSGRGRGQRALTVDMDSGRGMRTCEVLLLMMMMMMMMSLIPTPVRSNEHRNLKPMIQHAERSFTPHLSRRQIERATYPGDQHRLMGALTKMYKGDSVKIVTLGGSITVGQGVYDGSKSYVQRLRQWALSAWPQGNVQVLNGAFPGVNSDYFSTCAMAHVHADADIVIIELCVNDPTVSLGLFLDNRKAFERLVRTLLSFPKKPAVLLLNTYQPLNILDVNCPHKYMMNAEAFYFEVASFYGIPMMSMKAVTYHLSQQGVAGYLVNLTQRELKPSPTGHPDLEKYLFWDVMHPSGCCGHRLLYELVVHMLLKGSHALMRAGSRAPELEVDDAEPLPPPLFQGNFQAKRESCFTGDKFRQTAVEMMGFNWVNEAKKDSPWAKWGYTALTPGSFIKFKTSTMLSPDVNASPNPDREPSIGINLAFLKSYEHQGIAEVTCSGCQCKPSRLDGHQPGTTSQLSSHLFRVTQHPECIVLVTVLQDTTSGGHKVKLGALVVADAAGAAFGTAERLETIGGSTVAGETFNPEVLWTEGL